MKASIYPVPKPTLTAELLMCWAMAVSLKDKCRAYRTPLGVLRVMWKLLMNVLLSLSTCWQMMSPFSAPHLTDSFCPTPVKRYKAPTLSKGKSATCKATLIIQSGLALQRSVSGSYFTVIISSVQENRWVAVITKLSLSSCLAISKAETMLPA